MPALEGLENVLKIFCSKYPGELLAARRSLESLLYSMSFYGFAGGKWIAIDGGWRIMVICMRCSICSMSMHFQHVQNTHMFYMYRMFMLYEMCEHATISTCLYFLHANHSVHVQNVFDI